MTNNYRYCVYILLYNHMAMLFPVDVTILVFRLLDATDIIRLCESLPNYACLFAELRRMKWAFCPTRVLSEEELNWFKARKIPVRLFAECIELPLNEEPAQLWYLNGELHRDGDLPALIDTNKQVWHKHGKIHREGDLPAVIYADNVQQVWYKNDKIHRDGDLPAVIYFNRQIWYKKDKIHRDGDLPAIVYSDGGQVWCKHGNIHRRHGLPARILYVHGHGLVIREWFQNGKLHNPRDLPARIVENGEEQQLYYYCYGKLHRDNDMPAYIHSNGIQMWYHKNNLHRDGDLPAVITANGTREWWRHGIRHRDGGLPAIIDADGNEQWWQHGTEVTSTMASINAYTTMASTTTASAWDVIYFYVMGLINNR